MSRKWLASKQLKIIGVLLVAAGLSYYAWSVAALKDETAFAAIHIESMPFGLVLQDLSPKGVEIQVSGPAYMIRNLSGSDFRIALDLSTAVPGVHHITLRQEHLGLPEGIEVVRIHPPTVSMKIEKAGDKEVPVMVAMVGSPASGYRVADAVARPSSVILRGPEAQLARIDKVMTQSIDISGVSETLRKEIALDLLEGLTVSSPSALLHAEIYIEEQIVQKTFENLVVRGNGTSLAYRIHPSTVDIEISGPMNLVDAIDQQDDIDAYVDLKSLSPGVYIRPVAISLPLQTTLVSVTPEVFSVTLSE